MISYNELYKDVEKALSPKRFEHSKGVVARAIEYAKTYGVDEEIVKLTAIAHDIAKEVSKEEAEKLLDRYAIELDEIEIKSNNLVHAKLGAVICKEKYGFTSDMVNAVRYHTTGRANMSLLEKIIYLADATEAGRNYPSIEHYVSLVHENIDNATKEVAKWVIEDLLSKNKMIHFDTISCYNNNIKAL